MTTQPSTTPNGQRLPAPAPNSTRDLLQTSAVKQRFEQVLGDPVKAAQFIASLSTLVYASRQLKECDPNTIIASAVKAAALDLAIDPALGHAYIVPYKGKATFQIGWKGYVQLALRTGKYAALNVAHIYEGEVSSVNRFTGEILFGQPKSDKIVGVAAYLRLVNGFEKYVYWTLEEIHAHARKFSQSYGRSDSAWQTTPGAMEKKTVLKHLLTNYGMMSVEMRAAVMDEQPEVIENDPLFENPPTPEQRQAAHDSLWGRDDEPEQQAGEAPAAEQPAPPQSEAWKSWQAAVVEAVALALPVPNLDPAAEDADVAKAAGKLRKQIDAVRKAAQPA